MIFDRVGSGRSCSDVDTKQAHRREHARKTMGANSNVVGEGYDGYDVTFLPDVIMNANFVGCKKLLCCCHRGAEAQAKGQPNQHCKKQANSETELVMSCESPRSIKGFR